ncbi:MAG: hypothetical protein OXH61_04850, partial [Acidimicrobiaceae bacterium]|nr:hypothetical protein [Acidimicrobiaceae bacterium]
NNLADDPAHADLAAGFAAETAQRWDTDAIRERVLASQRSRRMLHAAMTIDGHYSWDFTPVRDGASEYVRDNMDWAEAGPRFRFPELA